jgi:uncharacterized protein (DUF58 family)
MSDLYVLFLILLAVIAVGLQQDFILTLLYLFVGAYALGRWWSHRALRSISFRRSFTRRAFLGERVPVQVEVTNASRLPVVWLQLMDYLPLTLAVPSFFRQVVTIGPRGRAQFEYVLDASRRGYYPIGPLQLRSGDLLGLADEPQSEGAPDYLTVYPKIVPLTRVDLPTRSPLGTLRHTQPIYEDPSRVLSKRDYVAGDSLRRVDWKATATLGRLQVKQFEPSIALETAIFLNLNAADYDYRTQRDDAELAIIVAASIANWIIGRRQAVGLSTNGADPVAADSQLQSVPVRKGRAHLIRLLEVLARVKLAKEPLPLIDMLQQERIHLAWGTTLIVITSRVDDPLFDEIFRSRRAGLDAMLILVGTVARYEETRRRARHFGIPVHAIQSERDLDLWRQ